MPSCEMCGAEGKLFRALIEGAQLNVCKKCASFGKIVEAPRVVVKKESAMQKPMPKRREIIQTIVPDCGRMIKERRERMGLTQEDFAKRLNEKESLIQKIESGKTQPSLALARKLESLLKMKLVEQIEDEGGVTEGIDSDVVTIGDVIKIKSRK